MTDSEQDDAIVSPVSEATTDNTSQTSGQTTGADEVTLLLQEIANLREQLARAQADYNNLVRRNREENAMIIDRSENKIFLKFLTVLDNLERALEHIPEEFKSHTWTEGFTSIVRSIQKTFTDFGVTRMNVIGEELDPDLHEVISTIPHENTHIQKEIEGGYLRDSRAIRHAKVIVGDGNI